MRTIVITSFHVFVSRNILVAPFFAELRAQDDLRIVLVVPRAKETFFQKEYGGANVIVVGIDRNLGFLDDLFRDFAAAAIHTRARAYMRQMNLGFERWYAQSLFFWAPYARRFIPALYRIFMPRNRYRDLFDAYRPDLIFATDVFSSADIILMGEARRLGIATVGMVRSWDNLIGKGGFRVIPDILVVNNEIIKNDAVTIHGINPAIIRVVGIPHYDRYLGGAPTSRDAFLSSLGLDPAKKTVLFAPLGDRFFTSNTFDKDVLDILLETLPQGTQIIVRCPPADTVNFEGMQMSSGVYLDKPGTHFSGGVNSYKQTELTRRDDDHLMNTLAAADLVVCGFTTLAIDAAVFDKPVIFIGFDGIRGLPEHDRVARHFEFEHIVPLLASGGVRLAKTRTELDSTIKMYLANPAVDQDERAKLVAEQGWKVDRRSSERLVSVLAEALAH